MDWFDLDVNMTYDEWKDKDKISVLSLIDFLQEIIDDEDDAGDE